jgi:hypothetical protein
VSADVETARARLAERQTRLVDALGGAAPAPAGFDHDRVALTARTLASKRRKGVARAWPSLAESLGGDFPDLFATYSAGARVQSDGPGADALAFARWLDARRKLPADMVPALVAATLGRCPPSAIRLRRARRRLFVGIHLPLLGVRVISLPYFAR